MDMKKLKRQFNYYVKRLNETMLNEITFIVARGGAMTDRPSNLFKNLNFNKLIEEGLTRKIKGKTVRITGVEAVKIQIQSLKNRTSRSIQNRRFIDNYLTSLNKIGMDPLQVKAIENALKRTPIDKIKYLTSKNLLPDIYRNYASATDTDKLYNEITRVLNPRKDNQKLMNQINNEYRNIKSKQEVIKEHVKAIWGQS